jgi:hypothetical protein
VNIKIMVYGDRYTKFPENLGATPKFKVPEVLHETSTMLRSHTYYEPGNKI